MKLTRLLPLVGLLFLPFCKQGQGERCQIDNDCEDGFTCVLATSASLAMGGSCQPQGGTTPSGTQDLSVTQSMDMSMPDLNMDLSGQDLMPVDGGG